MKGDKKTPVAKEAKAIKKSEMKSDKKMAAKPAAKAMKSKKGGY